MGTFVEYRGTCKISKEKTQEFRKHLGKVLNYGGMMELEDVRLFGHKILLLKPVDLKEAGSVSFSYNYFEDDSWENAKFDEESMELWSGKVGSAEFCRVMEAACALYEQYDSEPGIAEINGSPVPGAWTTGWLNGLLGTDFTLEQRSHIWDIMEKRMLEQRKHGYTEEKIDRNYLKNCIAPGWRMAAGGTELADLCNIADGTALLEEADIPEGSYPEAVLGCKRVLEKFFEKYPLDGEERLWTLLSLRREERLSVQGTEEKAVAEYTLFLPARVPVYLAAEQEGFDFWEKWKGLRGKVYRDETDKIYASERVRTWREQQWQTALEPIRTSDYLKLTGAIYFWDTPEELKYQENYYLSDAERLYWWDGTEEVQIPEKTEKWLKKLAEEHKTLTEEAEQNSEQVLDLEQFLGFLEEINEHYGRIFPFKSMFYDFIQNSSAKEYVAAVMQLQKLAKDEKMWQDGKVINSVRNWSTASVNVTRNAARLKLKRYLAVMANRELRMRYFEF